MAGLEQYDVKLLLVLMKSIAGRKDFFHCLLNCGHPELAAFSNAVRADIEALTWLSKNGYAWLAILSNAIDGGTEARLWVQKNLTEVNFRFALACKEEEESIRWLNERDLGIFLLLAREVNQVLITQELENAGPYVMHF